MMNESEGSKFDNWRNQAIALRMQIRLRRL